MTGRPAAIRLSALARALADAGRIALPAGSALQSLELVVPVTSAPILDPRRFWTLEVAQIKATRGLFERTFAWLPQWLPQWLPSWLGGRSHAASDPAWPLVKLTWSQGQVFASLVHPTAAPRPIPRGD